MRSQIQGIKSQNGPGRNLLGADFWFLVPTSRLERQGRSQKPKTTFLVSKSRLHSARPDCRLPDSDFKAPTEGSEENSRRRIQIAAFHFPVSKRPPLITNASLPEPPSFLVSRFSRPLLRNLLKQIPNSHFHISYYQNSLEMSQIPRRCLLILDEQITISC